MLTFEKSTPESTGIPSRNILQFIERLEASKVPMHSLLLLHHDKLIAEGYYAPYKADTLHRMFSISKSFTSVAIGLLEAEGKIKLSDHISQYFPEYITEQTHPWILNMTIEDMLMMRTCHASTTYKLNMHSDWVESFFIMILPLHIHSVHWLKSLAVWICSPISRKNWLHSICRELPTC